MTRFYSDLTRSISQKRREQIEKRKEEIRRNMFAAQVVNQPRTASKLQQRT